jgi:hypothetical protein
MRLSPQGVARWSARRRFTVIGAWVGLFLLGGLLTSRYLSGALTTQAQFTNHPDSKQAQQLLEQRLSGAAPRQRGRDRPLGVQDRDRPPVQGLRAAACGRPGRARPGGRPTGHRPPTRPATGWCQRTATPP